MNVVVAEDAMELGQRAGELAASLIRNAIESRGGASVLFATGTSQFHTLDALLGSADIAWPRVTGFHLDEYLGLSPQHPASFCRYLRERVVEQVPIGAFHFIDGLVDDPRDHCAQLGELIRRHTIDVGLIGIGENGHLAFNDPPADFRTQAAYHVVALDEVCRRQQLGEGWFDKLEEVPRQAISMTVPEVLKAAHLVCSVPDARKAKAVAAALEGPVTPEVPASMLQEHPQVSIFLDPAAACGLTFPGEPAGAGEAVDE